MKILVAACLAATVAICLGGPADAQAPRKHKKQYSSGQNGGATYRARQRQDANSTPDWYPHDSSQLPVGSKRWWEQKERESGGNRD